MEARYLPGDIRDRIRELLFNHHITQDTLAHKLGISSSKLSRFLRHETDVLEPWYIVQMAELFHVSTDFLLGLSDDRYPLDYEMSRLRLSGTALRKLVTGEVDAGVISQLIEHDSAGEITRGIRELQDHLVSDSLDAAARLTSQTITSAEAENVLSIEENPEIVQIKREARLCLSDPEDEYLTRQRICQLTSGLIGDLLKSDVYLHDPDDMISRHMLYELCRTAEEKTHLGFQKAKRVETLFKLWVQLCEVLDAPASVRSPLLQAYYQTFSSRDREET